MSTTLTDFLLARIAEDEAAADLVLRPYGDHASTNEAEWWPVEREWFKIGLSSDETPLLTRMTPQRVLAECKAKRVAVDWYLNDDEVVMGPTVEALAAVYADHPDFRDEWRP